MSRAAAAGGVAAVASLTLLGAATAEDLGAEANQLTVTSIGPGTIASEGYRDIVGPAAAMRMSVANRNTHRTPLPPHDSIDLRATVTANGRAYEISADQAIIADPRGRFTTWYGVGFGEWHEGRSHIGVLQGAARKSDVVAFALGEVRANGQLLASGVPIQVSATSGDARRLSLQIGEPNPTSKATSLRVSWPDFQAESAHRSKHARYIFGGGVLLIFLTIVFIAAKRQQTLLRTPQDS